MGEPEAAAPELTGEGVSEHSWSTDTLSLVSRQNVPPTASDLQDLCAHQLAVGFSYGASVSLGGSGFGRSVLQLLEAHQSRAGCR